MDRESSRRSRLFAEWLSKPSPQVQKPTQYKDAVAISDEQRSGIERSTHWGLSKGIVPTVAGQLCRSHVSVAPDLSAVCSS